MATFRVIESFEGRTMRGALRPSGGVEKTARRRFWVTSSSACTQYEVAAADGVPRIGDPFRGPGGFVDDGVFCDSVEPRQRDLDRLQWAVDCTYTNSLPQGAAGSNGLTTGGAAGGAAGDPRQEQSSPLLKPPVYRFDTRSVNWTVYQDADGNDILNSRGDPYEAGLETELEILVISVSRAEATFDPILARTFKGAINNDEYLGFPQWTVKMAKWAGSSAYENGVFYWQVDYELEVAPSGRDWQIRLLDQGYFHNYFNGAADEKRRFVDERTGQPAPKLGLLNGAGRKRGDADRVYYRTFRTRKALIFGSLGLFGPRG